MKINLYISVFLIGLFLIPFFMKVSAQQLPQHSLRAFDEVIYNPAVVGSTTYPEIKLHQRNQWVGFVGAPITSSLSYHSELTSTMGIGGFLMHDMTGLTQRTQLNLAYAYHLQIKKMYLALGLSGTFMRYSVNGAGISVYDIADNAAATSGRVNSWRPDASAGAYLYNQRFFVGISTLQLVQPKFQFRFDGAGTGVVQSDRSYYLMGGVNFKTKTGYFIEPSVLLNYTHLTPLVLDINAKLDYKNRLIFGASYRLKDAVVLIAGFRYKRYMVVYSYDIVASPLRTTNSGSHEIIVAYNWAATKANKPLFDTKGTYRGQIQKRVMKINYD